MAGNPKVAGKVKCQILSLEKDPRAPGRTIVSFKLDDSRGEPWIQAFTFIPPERPYSVEELLANVKAKGIRRPVDPFQFVKEAIETKEIFVLDLDK